MSTTSWIARVAVAAVVTGALALAATPAQAVDSPDRHGYATCALGYNPGSQALNWGTAKHQIGIGSSGDYLEKISDLGANPGYSRFKVSVSRAEWATISSPGGQRLLSTSWACRASTWK